MFGTEGGGVLSSKLRSIHRTSATYVVSEQVLDAHRVIDISTRSTFCVGRKLPRIRNRHNMQRCYSKQALDSGILNINT